MNNASLADLAQVRGLRLLVVSQYFYPEDFRVNGLVERLTELGAEVTVLTGLPNYPSGTVHPGYGWRGPWTESLVGAKVLRVPMVARGSSGRLRLVLNYVSYAFGACLLGPARLLGARFDAILVFQTSPVLAVAPALLIGAIKRAPVLTWVLDIWPESLQVVGIAPTSPIYRVAGRLSDWLYGKCSRLLLQSSAYLPILRQRRMPEQALVDFPNYAEDLYSSTAAADGPPAELAGILKPGHLTLMYAGNIGEAQGLEAVLEAAHQLKQEGAPFTWVFLGDGRGLPALRRRVAELGLEGVIHLLGRFPQQRMPGFFACADAMLVSLKASQIAALTVPGRIQSFLAAGKPIIATIQGEAADLIARSSSGLVSEPDDTQALLTNLRQFAAMSAQARQRMGENGQQYFQAHFRLDGVVARLMATIRHATQR